MSIIRIIQTCLVGAAVVLIGAGFFISCAQGLGDGREDAGSGGSVSGSVSGNSSGWSVSGSTSGWSSSGWTYSGSSYSGSNYSGSSYYYSGSGTSGSSGGSSGTGGGTFPCGYEATSANCYPPGVETCACLIHIQLINQFGHCGGWGEICNPDGGSCPNCCFVSNSCPSADWSSTSHSDRSNNNICCLDLP